MDNEEAVETVIVQYDEEPEEVEEPVNPCADAYPKFIDGELRKCPDSRDDYEVKSIDCQKKFSSKINI